MANQDWRDDVKGLFDWRKPGANPNWRDDAHSDIKEIMGFGPDKPSTPMPTMSAPNAGLIRSDNPRAGRDNWNQDPQFAQDQIDIGYLMPGTPEYAMMLRRMGANLGKPQAPAAAASTPPAVGAPVPSTAASRFPPAASPPSGSDVAEENRSRAIGEQGRSPTTMSTGVPAPAAVAEKLPSDPNLPDNKYPQSMIDQMEKDLTDLLTMRAPADHEALRQWRNLIETKRLELTRAKSAHAPQVGMGAGMPMLQAREAQERENNKIKMERQKVKDDQNAQDVLRQAREHYKGDPEQFNTWLQSQGYGPTGHKFKENMFDAKKKAEDKKTLTSLHQSGVLGGVMGTAHQIPQQAKAPAAQIPQAAQSLAPRTDGTEGTKSQLKQMLDAGFIDEAAFRKGINNPLGHKQTIEAIYDQYVKRFNPKPPHSPFPENSA